MAANNCTTLPPCSHPPPVLTDEQAAVVRSVAHHGRNAVVNAVAGSGKTYTALATAREWLARHPAPAEVLLVAYNRRLAQDMVAQRDAVTSPALRPRIHIRTIHGCGHHFFAGHGLTSDRHLSCWTRARTAPARPLPAFGLVVVDEAQDLTPVLFSFLCHLLSLLPRAPQLLVLGDPFQLLYRFNGADEAYVLYAPKHFADVATDAPFEHFKLSVSFRITHEMAAWINSNLNPNNLCRVLSPLRDCFERHRREIELWWGDGIHADPRRAPAPASVLYFQRPQLTYSDALQSVLKQVTTVFERYDAQSSALLCPFISSNPYNPGRLITNELCVVNDMPQSWFVDDHRMAGDTGSDVLLRNKRVASTIHKFKGRERDAIVLVGLDFFAENIERKDPRNTFNMFYVGATRARKELLIIQWSETAYCTHPARSNRIKNDVHKKHVMESCRVTKALEYCPYDEMLCKLSPACLQASTVYTVPSILIDREDYLVSGAHTPLRLSTMENISSVIGLAMEVRLQLILDEGILQVPCFTTDDDGPLDLQRFMMELRRQANAPRLYSWASVLQIATAFLTMGDQLFYRWRQLRNFESWHLVQHPAKLDQVVRNLMCMLHVVCKDDVSEAATKASDPEAGVAYEDILNELKRLRKEQRILFHDVYTFDMGGNPRFVLNCSPYLVGQPDIIVLSKQAAERRRRLREIAEDSDGDGIESDPELVNGDGTTLIEVKATSQTNHDHLLQVACYGAMLREIGLAARKECMNEKELVKAGLQDIQLPRMLVAYANLGLLTAVELHMDSFEFLHRVGCRKINHPFDSIVLGRNVQARDAIEACEAAIVLSQEMSETE